LPAQLGEAVEAPCGAAAGEQNEELALERNEELALERNEAFLSRCGGRVSSEWIFPKILQILEEDPIVYDAAYRFMEAGDWAVIMLTGEQTRNSCAASAKALWNGEDGFPPEDYFKALDKRLGDVIDSKIGRRVDAIDCRAGGLTKAMAEKTGLRGDRAQEDGDDSGHLNLPLCAQ